jgi:mannose-6-phosphate isomerase-like protein (cupin superfamily)
MDCVTMFNYITADDLAGFSLARGEIRGSHDWSRSSRSTRGYFICAGEGDFEVEDESYAVSANDVVLVPAGSRHKFMGEFDYIVINVPPYDPSAEVAVDD